MVVIIHQIEYRFRAISSYQTLRQVGRDDEADVVYLERQRRERLQSWTEKSYGEWVFSATYATLGNYGVRPYRLLIFAGGVIWLGALVFQLPGAVVRKDKLGPDALLPTQLSRFDALALSEIGRASCRERV